MLQPRRLRNNPILRKALSETDLKKTELIQPIFIHWGQGIKKEIKSMPGIYQLSLDNAFKQIEVYLERGLDKFMLFGIPEKKDEVGSDALSEDGIIAKSIREIKKRFPESLVMSDVCFCEYTDHGHCGLLKDKQVDNAGTIANLAKQALLHAQCGVDMVAPSAMMDNMVLALEMS